MTDNILLLVEKCSHCLSYYDIDTGERLASIQLPDFPHEFVIDSQERYAYIGHYGVETSGHLGFGGTQIFQVDIARRELARTIDIAPFNRLHGMQMDAQDRLYALSEDRAQLVVLDHPATDTAPRRAVSTGGIKSHLFALTRDGQTAYAMNLLSHTVTKIRPHDATVAPVACAPGEKPEGYALSEDEKTLYVHAAGATRCAPSTRPPCRSSTRRRRATTPRACTCTATAAWWSPTTGPAACPSWTLRPCRRWPTCRWTPGPSR
ncbi:MULTISPECIES: YncE family protein [unclassified Acidovorax]|uniref:YncE family protein n=1 Tax=unclassified Acidovorax TaxID=2684926 RepID=UPI000AC61BC4|nr:MULTISPECIES: YncE family protein [unclassified Acidovorax]